MLIAITGSSGYIGTALRETLTAAGHNVLPVRRGRPEDQGAMWDPSSNWVRPDAFDNVDAVVHLSGVSIAAKRWTKTRKVALRTSRVHSTALLATHLAAMPKPPETLIIASGAGYYGDAGDEVVREDASQGTGFLAELVADWEAAAAPADAAGVRVVHARFGPLIGRGSELIERLLLPFRLGLGGRIGHGRQWLPWVSTEDAIRAIAFALQQPRIRGAVNVVAPHPVRNREFASALGRELHRPAVIPIPEAALSLLFGRELVSETLLASQRVKPAVLEATGFTFLHPTVEDALRAALKKDDAPALVEDVAE